MNLESQMADVRRASRLLAAYYRRLVTILETLHAVMVESGLAFDQGAPTHFSPTGSTSKAPFGRWGWDFLPWYDATFVWTSGATKVVVRHVTDSGFKSADGLEPDPASFGDVTEADSYLQVEVQRDATTPVWSRRWRMTELATREDVDAIAARIGEQLASVRT